MRLVRADDPSVTTVFQGVRQDHLGQCYREGRTSSGEAVKVDATDSRDFRLSEGSFFKSTLHIVVTEPDGTQYRAGTHKALKDVQ